MVGCIRPIFVLSTYSVNCLGMENGENQMKTIVIANPTGGVRKITRKEVNPINLKQLKKRG